MQPTADHPAGHGIAGECWAILPNVFHATLALLRQQAMTAPTAAAPDRGRTDFRLATAGPIAVLPVYGVIQQRPTWLGFALGWTSTDELHARYDVALRDPAVKAIVLDVDSPGGNVYGVAEIAAHILATRGIKPVVAVANSLAASAAYWIASAADQIAVTPSGEVGSIGVVSVHLDVSQALEAEGLKYTLISAGKYKTEGAPYTPLGDDARAHLQGRVDDYYGTFVRAVARGRGVSPGEVEARFGQGRVVGAREAIRSGLADQVMPMADVLGYVTRQVDGQLEGRLRAQRLLEIEAGVDRFGMVKPSPILPRDHTRRLEALEQEGRTERIRQLNRLEGEVGAPPGDNDAPDPFDH